MPVLPIPMIVTLVLLAMLVQRLVTQRTRPVALLVLIALCACVSALSALVHYYGFAEIRFLQPLLATGIPPVAWVAFSSATEGARLKPARWLHVLPPLAAAASIATAPDLLDVLIPVTFASYGIAILVGLGRSEDSLIHSSLADGVAALWAWRIVALSLVASAICDIVIFISLARGQTGPLLWLPTIFSALSLLSLGVLSLSHAIETQHDEEEDGSTPHASDAERDNALVATVDAYVERQKPYLDPDLTLARLARKLVLPAKQLSAAINRVKGENVSRYINRHRVEEACRLMAAGRTVTAAMFEAGFNTKSNFNREFLRIKKMPPRRWLSAQAQGL